MKHKTKDGELIELCDLELSHLKNIIKWIERKAKEGTDIMRGGGSSVEDIWCDVDTIYGKEVFERMNYNKYTKELQRRIKI